MTLLLEQPYGGMGAINPAGHSAIYLDHVCAENPLQLRPCRPGELGAVISRYNDIGGYDWVAIPLLPYLYAVEQADAIPQSVDAAAVSVLRDRYRRAHLEAVAADLQDGSPPEGNWYELIGSAFDRTIYGFTVNSTDEQDRRLMALLNDRRNVQRYNGMFRNCADFTRVTLNRFYPHAVRRNLIADLGLSTPKSVARGLTHYAAKHPEAGLQVFVIPQVKGSLPRSHSAEGVSESLLKKYGVPLTLLSPVATGLMFVAYVGHGRFSMPHDPPVLDLNPPLQTAEPLRPAFALESLLEPSRPASREPSPLTGKPTLGNDPIAPVPLKPAAETLRSPVPAAQLAPEDPTGRSPATGMLPVFLVTPVAADGIPAAQTQFPGFEMPLFR